MKTAEELKLENADIVQEFSILKYKEKIFKPGRSVIQPSGKVIGVTELKYIVEDKNQLHESSSLKFDCLKAYLELGWKSNWSIETALNNIIERHKCDDINSYELCCLQNK